MTACNQYYFFIFMNTLKATCPMCDEEVSLENSVVESERIMCPECNNAVVVHKIAGDHVELIEAPAVEEDWGE